MICPIHPSPSLRPKLLFARSISESRGGHSRPGLSIDHGEDHLLDEAGAERRAEGFQDQQGTQQGGEVVEAVWPQPWLQVWWWGHQVQDETEEIWLPAGFRVRQEWQGQRKLSQGVKRPKACYFPGGCPRKLAKPLSIHLFKCYI